MNQTAETEAGIPREARKWATICHISSLVGLMGNGIGFILGPLIVWLIKKDDHPFVDQQGKEALNFQLTMFISLVISALLCLVLIGFVLLLIVFLMMLILPIIAAIKVNNGEDYRYPLTIRIIK